MNYPLWELTWLNSGTLVALISIPHVYISHLAVGGGIFLWITDWLSVRGNDPELGAWARRQTWFFLLTTMVFGGVSGVGIWFIIALANPAATSLLIHHFVFGWAIEWVFFVGEIVALLVYHYRYAQMSIRDRLNVIFLYALFAWLSLVVINGIVAFMLTPGAWLKTFDFWDGFFNPTYFPSLFFRTGISLMLAGFFGMLTAVFLPQGAFRKRLMRYCVKWIYYPAPLIALSAIWYYRAIPGDARFANFVLNNQSHLPIVVFMATSILICATGALFLIRVPARLQKYAVAVIILAGLGWMGSFEYLREYARKPFVIKDFMYSTSIAAADVEKINREGLLKLARWTPVRQAQGADRMKAGRELFNIQCLACHTIRGVKNDIVEKTKHLTYRGVISHLYGQGKALTYMPPFVGTAEEREALAAFIAGELNGKSLETAPARFTPKLTPVEIPPFDPKKDNYVLLAWNDIGLHCLSDAYDRFMFLPPANTLQALLIRRGDPPEMVADGVEIRYKVEKGFENPSRHVRFWEFAPGYYGRGIDPNVGIAGKGMSGVFDFDKKDSVFVAEAIPAAPYRDNGEYNPYPLFHLEAIDKKTGKILQKTSVVAPVSTEIGCRNCHEGGWRWNNVSGLAGETADNILRVHDRINHTQLLKSANAGKPVMCQQCHADPAVASKGKPGYNNFSAAIHGWHANYMHEEGSKACALCHPSAPFGNTVCDRGVHVTFGIGCTDCHGSMDEHAAALLKGQPGARTSAGLLKNLKTAAVGGADKIVPRSPWVQEPDCLNCHVDYKKPAAGFASFNKWGKDANGLYRNRTDEAGAVRCIACHNSMHANYTAQNIFGASRDNIQPLQYQKIPRPIAAGGNCQVCHTARMEDQLHHPEMIRKVGK